MSYTGIRGRDDLSVEAAGTQGTVWRSFREGKVSFRMRRLEPRLAWATAAYTCWAAALLSPADPVVWALALYAGAIGLWCHRFPALHQGLMFTRGALLLAGALVLQAAPGAGGPTGPYFIWPVMIATFYALALPRRWAVVLVGLALAQFAAANALGGAGDWRLALALAGALCIFPGVAMLFGRAMRELDRQAEIANIDRGSHLYNEQGFLSHGGELFDECRRARRAFTLILLNCADVAEVSDLTGRQAANLLFARLVDELKGLTPREGLAARTGPAEFAVVLPGVSAQRAAALLHQRLGNPPKVALRSRGDLITVMLDSAIAEATPDVPTLEDFHERLHAKLLKCFGVELPEVPNRSSTLGGLLDAAPRVPNNARPTMPMSLGPAARYSTAGR
jgi:GGDEF domain-containing protein